MSPVTVTIVPPGGEQFLDDSSALGHQSQEPDDHCRTGNPSVGGIGPVDCTKRKCHWLFTNSAVTALDSPSFVLARSNPTSVMLLLTRATIPPFGPTKLFYTSQTQRSSQDN